jgi:hypothetical protein
MPKIETRLNALTNVQLAAVYNNVADRQVSKFSDHSTAVKRTLTALEAKGYDFTVDDDGATVTVGPVGTLAPVRRAREGDDRTITVVADSNPKAKGSKSARRFGLYKTGMTVGQYVEAASKIGGGRRKAIRDITWDTAHGFIKLA